MPAQTTVTGAAYYSEGDTAPPLRRQLIDGDGLPYDLSEADEVAITISPARYSHYYSPYVPIVERSPCGIDNPPEDGWVSWIPQSGELTPVGSYHYIFEITWEDGTRQTVPANTYEVFIIRAKPGGIL